MRLLILSAVLVACSPEDVPIPAASAPPETPVAVPTSDGTPAHNEAAMPGRHATADLVEIGIEADISHADGPHDLTLRSSPTTESDALVVMPDGAGVYVEACQDLGFDDAWCRIRYEEGGSGFSQNGPLIGWAKRRHLAYFGNIDYDDEGVRVFGDPGMWGYEGTYAVDGRWDIQADDGYANVRSGPGTNHDVTGRLTNGVVVEVSRCTDAEPGRRWCAVRGPAEGYVHQSGFHRYYRQF